MDGLELAHRLCGGPFPDTLERLAEIIGLTADAPSQKKIKPKEVKAYSYHDAEGKELYQVVRMEPKSFRQRRPDGKGGWIYNLKGIEPVLYRLPEVIQAQTVLLVEGEKDADTAAAMGFTATTAPMGAGKWRDSYTKALAGKDVVIIPDQDEAGEKHARKVTAALVGTSASVRRVDMPAPHKDLSDWADAGGTAEQLQQLIDQAKECTSESIESEEDSWKADVEEYPELPPEALQGIAGRFVELATHNSEADPAAVLIQMLARFGAEAGRNPYIRVGDTRHHSAIFVIVVGQSSKARKGTSYAPVDKLFQLSAFDYTNPCTSSPGPLSSGEGIVYALRDEIREWDKKAKEYVVTDPGVEDKRIFIVDEEIAALFQAVKRDGNTASPILRRSWDGNSIAPMTKGNRISCSAPHLVAVGHIVQDELLALITASDCFNGFANRFLFCCARRQRRVPFPQPMPENELKEIQKDLKYVLTVAQSMEQEITFDDEARQLWINSYDELTEAAPGRLGAVTNRSEAQVIRLSLLYALLDGSDRITYTHLRAALALWSYCRASAAYIFGSQASNKEHQRVIDALKEHGSMTLTQISTKVFKYHKKSDELRQLLTQMIESGTITQKTIKTTGRSRTEFTLTSAK
jgi:5S rRNA maturation endonuclease (ribonuclease M5)